MLILIYLNLLPNPLFLIPLVFLLPNPLLLIPLLYHLLRLIKLRILIELPLLIGLLIGQLLAIPFQIHFLIHFIGGVGGFHPILVIFIIVLV